MLESTTNTLPKINKIKAITPVFNTRLSKSNIFYFIEKQKYIF